MMKARFLAIVAAVCTCGVAQGQDEPQPSATETGLPQQQAFRFPQLGQAEAFWSRRLGGYIRSADGTRLKYSVLLPEGSGRFPVVLTINGYDAGSIGGAAYLKYQTSMSLELDRRLVEAGYAVMAPSLPRMDQIAAVTGRITLAEVCAFVLVSYAAQRANAWLLSWRPLVYMGRLSYGIYLWHFPLTLVLRNSMPPWEVLAWTLPFSFGMAALCLHLVDLPLKRWRGSSGRALSSA